ncbi:MAG: MalY/PatB family protein [Acidimicrobiales bacterium]
MRFDDLDLADLRRRRGAKWGRYGPDVLPAWVADMDFEPPEPVRRAVLELVETGDLGYPWIRGETNPVIDAFVARMHDRFGWAVDPERVALTGDVLQPIAWLLELWSAPGDGVAIQTPIYPPFLRVVEETGRRVVDNPLGAADAGAPLDLDGLRAALAAEGAEGRTKVLLLCHPHNPSGRVFTEAELRGLGELAVERDLIVISDEIHADLVYPGRRFTPFAALEPAFAERTVTLTSATKAFNIAGLRLAVAVFGSARLHERWLRVHPFLLGGVGAPGIAATVAAWRHGQPWLDELIGYLDGNRRLVEEFVTDRLPGVAHVKPEATYLAWLDCRELVRRKVTDNPAELFLEKAKVALNDGADFGVHGQGFVRLNFATSRALLTEILERMEQALL